MTDPKNDFVVSEGGNDRTVVSVWDSFGMHTSAALTDEQIDDLIRELGGTPAAVREHTVESLRQLETLEEAMADAEGCEEHREQLTEIRSELAAALIEDVYEDQR